MSLFLGPGHACGCFSSPCGANWDWTHIVSSARQRGHPVHDSLWSPKSDTHFVFKHKVGGVGFNASICHMDGIQNLGTLCM